MWEPDHRLFRKRICMSHIIKLKRENGEKRYIVRAYGIKDNPKKTLEERGSFLAGDLRSFINLNNLKTKDIWESEDHSLENY